MQWCFLNVLWPTIFEKTKVTTNYNMFVGGLRWITIINPEEYLSSFSEKQKLESDEIRSSDWERGRPGWGNFGRLKYRESQKGPEKNW